MAPLRIEVTGEAKIFHPAERAVVSISVQSEGPSQEEVANDVAIVSAEIRNILKDLAKKDKQGETISDAPITHWSNSSLSTGSYFRFGADNEQKTRVHEARTSFEVKFRDFAKLGSVATTLSTMKHVAVTNVKWRLTEKTKLGYTSQCRREAVRDAVAKARDYAAALDREVPSVVEVRDTNGGGAGSFGGGAPMRMMAYHAEATQEELQFTPEDVSLACTVLVVLEERV